jgi:hypothetical protein
MDFNTVLFLFVESDSSIYTWQRIGRGRVDANPTHPRSNLNSVVEPGGVLERSPLALAVSLITALKD